MSSQEYAQMIELPISTCQMAVEITPEKKRRKSWFIRRANKDILKAQNQVAQTAEEEKSEPISPLIEENIVNDGAEECYFSPVCDGDNDCAQQNDCEMAAASNLISETAEQVSTAEKKTGKKFKFDIIAAQVTAIVILAVGLLVTNIFWEDSGINTAFKALFSSQQEAKDLRAYSDFSPILPCQGEISLEGGVMSIEGVGAVYSPCEGKLEKVEKIGDKYALTISHSDLYKTVISGADYVYFAEGDEIFTSSPVCYSLSGGVQVAMYDENTLISDYTIDSGKVVWEE